MLVRIFPVTGGDSGFFELSSSWTLTAVPGAMFAVSTVTFSVDPGVKVLDDGVTEVMDGSVASICVVVEALDNAPSYLS